MTLLILLTGCDEEKPFRESSDAVSAGKVLPDQVTSNAHIYLYRAGRKTTDLIADEIQKYTRLDSTIAIHMTAEFYDSTGARISTLTADRGFVREKDNFMRVAGSVVVIGQDSVRLETEYLEWDAERDRVVTDSFVTITRNNDILHSYGMETDPGLKNTTLKKKVSGRLTEVEKLKK